jgi:hypothetical protein
VVVEGGIDGAEEGAVVVVARAHRRHPPVDVVDGASRAALCWQLLRLLPLPPSTPEPEPIDGFKFGITLYYGGDPDSIRMPRKFADMVDMKTK